MAAAAAAAPETAFEIDLNVEEFSFLKSHVMSGKAVLPVAVIMEWLAAGALHNNPGLSFHGFDELRVYNGVVLEPGKPCVVRIIASKLEGDEGSVRVELKGGLNFMRLHAAGNVVLTKSLPKEEKPELNPATGTYRNTVEKAYSDVLFHGKDFEVITDVESSSDDGIVAKLSTAPAPASWMTKPLTKTWLGDPLVMDGAFQLMILWTDQHLGEVSLPNYLKSYRQYVREFPKDGVKAVISAKKKSAAAANADMEFVDSSGNVLATVEGYECTMSPSLRAAFEKRTLG